MKLLDRIMSIPPEKAIEGDLNYESCRFGGRTCIVGLVAIGGGFVANGLGFEIDGPLLLSGTAALLIGGMALVAGETGMNNQQ